MVAACALSGVAPIDSPFFDLHDDGGLKQEITAAMALGFSAKAAIHPTQIGAINSAMTPSAEALDRARATARQEATVRGAKHTVHLPVAVPSHTPFLSAASNQFRDVVRAACPRPARTEHRLLSGIDGDTVYDIDTGTEKLAGQISTTIDWAACLASCRSAGAQAASELGPGTALSRLTSPLFPEGRARAVDEFRTLD